MQVDLSSFDNRDYNPGGALKRGIWYFFNVIFILNPWNPFIGLKRGVLRLFGAKIGKGVIIKPRVNVKYPWFLEIGDNSWIGEQVWIDNLGSTKIGANVCISQGALLLCGNHNYKKKTFDLMVGEIIIEDGVWIGARSIVSGGKTCYSHAILTAGSVATSDLKKYGIYKGNPAEWIRERKIESDD
ncbi:MAG: WcaF family extracellular polysaccharide biosynthesis acetyltransferase [Crocinitomicaceae bacterium]